MRPLRRLVQPKALQLRIALLTTLAVAVAVVVSNTAGYVALRTTLVHASQSIALSIAEDLVDPVGDTLATTGGLDETARQAGGVVVEAIGTDGTVARLPRSPELVLGPQDVAVAGDANLTVRRTGVDTAGTPYVVVTIPLDTPGYALVVARPLRTLVDILHVERIILLCVGAASIAAAAMVSGLVARTGLRPVRQLTAAVEHVRLTNDLQPVALRDAPGEVGVLSAEFNQLLRSLASLRDRQVRLVADASHELRTPLTSLTMNVDLLVSDADADLIPRVQKTHILRDVQAQIAELNDLVGDLVHLSRPDASSRFEPLDLGDVVRGAVERVQRRAADRTFDVELGEFFLRGDASGLERAVVNLLDNAVKWGPPGSIVGVHLHGNRLVITDEGPGIPEADLPYVFDRFFRGDTARQAPGTGLGLSIVAKTVEDHGGTVEAGRAPGGGACFTIRLPGATSPEGLNGPPGLPTVAPPAAPTAEVAGVS